MAPDEVAIPRLLFFFFFFAKNGGFEPGASIVLLSHFSLGVTVFCAKDFEGFKKNAKKKCNTPVV